MRSRQGGTGPLTEDTPRFSVHRAYIITRNLGVHCFGGARQHARSVTPHSEYHMAASESLKDIYADEMKDLLSANNQMTKVVKVMSEKAHDPKLKQTLEQSISGINKHAEMLKALLTEAGEKAETEHCKGMEGLVKEATKHITKEAPKDGELLDIVIIAQYQRMSHYGLAGFGTAAAYAKALGMKDHHTKLTGIVAAIYKGDEYATKLATATEQAARL
jgi:ferritin-like metal-binding protein YciE